MEDDESLLDERWAELVRRIDADTRLIRAWELTGGVSARVTGIEIEQADGGREKLVVRRHGAVDFAQNPNVAVDEFTLLKILHGEGLPVPSPRYVEGSGDIFGTPCIVVDFIDGATDLASASAEALVTELAAQLARIHAIDTTRWDLSFLPDHAQRCAARLAVVPANCDDALDEGRIRAVLTAAWPLEPRNRPVLLHGDFWPGNTLWLNGELTGIIDWEDAGIGDPLADLANTRLEMLLLLGPGAMRRFTQQYLASMPVDVTGLPYWDLCAALRPIAGMPNWGLADAALQNMRAGLRSFITQAFAALERP